MDEQQDRDHQYIEDRIDDNRIELQRIREIQTRQEVQMGVILSKLDTLDRKTSGLIKAWETTSGLALFIKWLVAVVTSVLVLWHFAGDAIRKFITSL